MALNSADIGELSRLFDQGLALPVDERSDWLARLPAPLAHLARPLQEMLDQSGPDAQGGLLSTLPKLDACDLGPRAGDHVGPYRILGPVGQGGMSTVCLAEKSDGELRRLVALKMPRLTLSSASQIERFQRERDVLALLNHPQVARLYDAGVAANGRPFVVLEHVVGKPITEACDALGMGIEGRVRMFLELLSAVEHAHLNLVVHRDIKPSNVFVDAQGHVKLLDFGIAKLLDSGAGPCSATRLTQEAGAAYTPTYAAPEQVGGKPVSLATDIYSLGVLLYELLTGSVPHAQAQDSVVNSIFAKLNSEPQPPSQAALTDAAVQARAVDSPERLRAALKGDLDAIVLMALRQEPGSRYRTAERMANDLQRYLSHRPVAARRAPWVYRARLFARRHLAAVTISMLGLTGVAAFAGLAAYHYHQAQEGHLRTEAIRDFMFDMFGDAEPDEARPGVDVTAKQLIVTAIERARRDFSGLPVLQGEIFKELWRMQDRLGSADPRDQLLEEASSLLERHAPNDDPSLNHSRYLRAEQAMLKGDPAHARSLANQVVQSCTRAGPRCAKVTGYAQDTLGRIALDAGDAAAVRGHLQASLAALVQGFGPEHTEVTLARMRQALALRNIGALVEAENVFADARRLGAGQRVSALDRLELDRTAAVLDFDMGRYAIAADEFEGLLGQATLDVDRALLWRLLAQAQLAMGLPDKADVSARKAVQMAGPGSAANEVWLARQALARAHALAGGDHADPAIDMNAVLQGLLQTASPMAAAPLRARRFQAEILLRHGEVAPAQRELQAVERAQFQAGDSQALERAQTLDLIGIALRLEGRSSEAAASHGQARELLQGRLPQDHPWLERNALLLAVAQHGPAALSEKTAHLRATAAHYARRFPPDSLWRASIDQCLAHASGTPVAGCPWLL